MAWYTLETLARYTLEMWPHTIPEGFERVNFLNAGTADRLTMHRRRKQGSEGGGHLPPPGLTESLETRS